jgi:hypothetical protein
VIFALGLSTVSLLFAVYLLWPGYGRGPVGAGLVKAAEPAREELVATRSAPSSLPADPRRVALGQSPIEAAAAETELPAMDAPAIECQLVDEAWRPVPGAEVWVDDGAWRLAGASDAQGVFSLSYEPAAWERRFAAGKDLKLGARARDHGPALVTTLDAPPTAPVRLVLRGAGARLRLEVIDPEGRPIADARVAFHDEFLPGASASIAVLDATGTYSRPTPVPPATTDTWGQVEFFGLEPGERGLQVEHGGFCTRRAELMLLEGEFVTQRLRLDPASGVRGRVLRLDGGSVEGTLITGVGPDPLTEVKTSCDAEGRFELAGLPAGPVRLFAESGERNRITHAARTERTLRAGEWWKWDPTLTPVELLRGHLLDSDGFGLVGWRVDLREGEGPAELTELTDEEGLYELPRPRHPESSRLLFFHPLAVGGLPSRIVSLADAEFDLPTVQLEEGFELASSIRGRILKPNGLPASGLPVVLHRQIDHATLTIYPDPATGDFETPPLPPGDYVVVFPTHGRGWAPNQIFKLDGREQLDLGVVLLPAKGKLSVYALETDRCADSVEMRMELLRPGISLDHRLPVFIGTAEIPQQFVLAPGEYRLQLPMAEGSEPRLFTVESGQTTHLLLSENE